MSNRFEMVEQTRNGDMTFYDHEEGVYRTVKRRTLETLILQQKPHEFVSEFDRYTQEQERAVCGLMSPALKNKIQRRT